jgi:hypothetical protein
MQILENGFESLKIFHRIINKASTPQKTYHFRKSLHGSGRMLKQDVCSNDSNGCHQFQKIRVVKIF